MERECGLELLRILLALMIVANHSIGHGIKEIYPELFQQYSKTFSAIQVIANPAVNIFFLVSGYFGIKPNKKKILTLLDIIYTYAIGILVFLLIVEGWNYSLFLRSFIIPWEYWWFATVYLILFIISGCINIVLNSLDERRLDIYFFVLIIINFIQGFLFNGAYWGDGFSIVQAVTMYCMGYWIKKKLDKKNIRSSLLFVLYIIFSIFTLLLTYYADLNNVTSITKRVFSYNNPLVMCESVCLFLLFKNIKINNQVAQGVIKFFSSAVFSIYLLTDHPEMRQYIFGSMIERISKFGNPFILVLGNAIVWTLAVSILDYLRKHLRRFISEQNYVHMR